MMDNQHSDPSPLSLSSENMQRRPMPIGRRFQPGVSGNPGGRPAHLAEVKELARSETAASITALVEIRDDAEAPAAARVAAANSLLDRGWGRPVLAVAVEPRTPFDEMTIDQREMLEALLQAVIEQRSGCGADGGATVGALTHG